MKMINIQGREILDAAGLPTIACDITLADQTVITGIAPSSSVPGPYAAAALRDHQARLLGLGVQQAIDLIRTQILPAFLGVTPDGVHLDLKLLELDGTDDKSRLGANTMLAVSQAVFRAQAYSEQMELFELIALVCDHSQVTLPIPLISMLQGPTLAPQSNPEYLAIPYGAKTARLALERTVLLRECLKRVLVANYGAAAQSAQGTLTADFPNLVAPLDNLLAAVELLPKTSDGQFALGINLAAQQCYQPSKQLYHFDQQKFDTDGLISWYIELCSQYPLYLLADGLAVNDWAGWKKLVQALGPYVHIAAGSLIASRSERLAYAAEQQALGAVIVQPLQVGTVTEAIQALKLAQEHDLMTILAASERETLDPFIVDLAVGTNTTHVQLGALNRGENVQKYNRLLEIEDFLLTGGV